MGILVLNEKEIRRCIALDQEVLRAVAHGFIRLSEGAATVPPIMMIPIPERKGEVDVKAAYIQGLDGLAVKIASGFFENQRLHLPSSSGLMIVLSAITGFPEAVLLDNGYLTQVRTGAAGAIAAQFLAPKKVEVVGVVGAGVQARFQILALKLVRDFQAVMVYGRRAEQVESYRREMAPRLGVPITAARSLEQLVGDCSVLVTTTPAREPLIQPHWLHPGLHITAMGADTEEKQELHPGVLQRAELIACDLKSQCLRLGELHHALASGALSRRREILELGELCAGKKAGRQNEEQISVCDLTGVGVQDTEIALLALARAKSQGLGLSV